MNVNVKHTHNTRDNKELGQHQRYLHCRRRPVMLESEEIGKTKVER